MLLPFFGYGQAKPEFAGSSRSSAPSTIRHAAASPANRSAYQQGLWCCLRAMPRRPRPPPTGGRGRAERAECRGEPPPSEPAGWDDGSDRVLLMSRGRLSVLSAAAAQRLFASDDSAGRRLLELDVRVPYAAIVDAVLEVRRSQSPLDGARDDAFQSPPQRSFVTSKIDWRRMSTTGT